MSRSTTISTPHPSPRFGDKIRLRQFRRSPTDLLWSATFRVDGQWQTAKPISLGTTDFAEACERARDKYTAMNGEGVQTILRPYRSSAAKPPVAHRFADYAQRAINKLELQAQAADTATRGKGHNFYQIARRIRCDLIPAWGETDITQLTEDELRHWIEFTYRVEDVKATVALHGRQPRSEARQRVLVKPASATLGSLDQALLHVWTEAVADRVVERRTRPMIDRSLGEDSEQRAFIDGAALQAMAKVMTDAWVNTDGKLSSNLRRLLRVYVALVSASGLRPGLETKRIRVGDVHFEIQREKPVIIITVLAHQGKHPKRRDVVVLESGIEFNVRHLLLDLVVWRRSHGAHNHDLLFAYPDGREPTFRYGLNTVLRKANALTDPDTGEKRSAYSLRHFFATKLIAETDLSIPVIAAWMGTSSAMIERHYNRFVLRRQADRVVGVSPWVSMMSETARTDPDIVVRIAARAAELKELCCPDLACVR